MEVKVHGYTLHGDYYLADKVITNVKLEKALKMKEEITLPNGKTVIAHTLSKEELETIPREERKIDENGHYWYLTSTPYNSKCVWYVVKDGGFFVHSVAYHSYASGGARLGFKNPF